LLREAHVLPGSLLREAHVLARFHVPQRLRARARRGVSHHVARSGTASALDFVPRTDPRRVSRRRPRGLRCL